MVYDQVKGVVVLRLNCVKILVRRRPDLVKHFTVSRFGKGFSGSEGSRLEVPSSGCVPWAVLASSGLIHTVTELSGLSTVSFPPVSSIYTRAVLPASIYAHTGSDIAPSKAAVINAFNTAFFNALILILLFTMIIPFHSFQIYMPLVRAVPEANNLSDRNL